MTFDAQDEGYLAKILVGSGDIKVGQPIMVTVDDAANVAAFSSFKLEGVAAAASAAAPVAPAAAKPVAAAPAKAVVAASPPSSSSDDGSRVVASPFARKLARDNGVDIALLKGKGSGPNGRIVAADIANAPALLSASKAAGAAKTAVGKAVSTKGSSTGSVYEDFELSDLSRALADRFTKSKVHVPHYYLSVELNLAKLLELRQQLNSDNKADDGCSVSVLDLLVKATGLAVKQVPDVNGSWNESFIRRYTQVDINLVMGAGASVVTPVIRNVNTKGLRQITSEIAGFEDNLFREDKTSGAFSTIDPSALAPGTFSIHNLGMFGVKSAAPIILPPQACALAFGAVVDSVVPRAGAGDNWEVAPVMVATLSCDHRYRPTHLSIGRVQIGK